MIDTLKDGPIEYDLIKELQPIRLFVKAIMTYHLFNTGIFNKLEREKVAPLERISEELDFDPNKLKGFLNYLCNENLIYNNQYGYALTNEAYKLKMFSGWYTMLIGGYAETFLQIGECVKKGSGWATRDAAKVGIGSCRISHYDAIPLTKSLMEKANGKKDRLLDLGCGNALYLAEFCTAMPNIQAWGVEPDKVGYKSAIETIKNYGLEDRVKLTNCNAIEFFKRKFDFEPDFTVLGFVLHEILGQEGREGVVSFLKSIKYRFPKIKIIIIEVIDRIDEPMIMQHGLSKAYYNSYYLLHYFTNQKLVTEEEWIKIFKKAGFSIITKETTNKNIDSTGLEIGYLLEARG